NPSFLLLFCLFMGYSSKIPMVILHVYYFIYIYIYIYIYMVVCAFYDVLLEFSNCLNMDPR
ncbi:MAG: hypothetical protein N7Q72_06020, partial [Spiroplasma sp. Tabriz.8]|nr:hypothetical protein [Candidatus Karelsulcia muelleri]MCZ8632802.1 hypothetical protein [Spiroplasma sp. Tabriz.8]